MQFSISKATITRATTIIDGLDPDVTRADFESAIVEALPASSRTIPAALESLLANEAIAHFVPAQQPVAESKPAKTEARTRYSAALSDDSVKRASFNAAIVQRRGTYPRERTTRRDCAYFALLMLAANVCERDPDSNGNVLVEPADLVRTHAVFGDVPTAKHNGKALRNPLTVAVSADTGKRVSAPLLNRGIFDHGSRFDRSGDLAITEAGYTFSVAAFASAIDAAFGNGTAERLATVASADVPTLAGILTV